MKERWLDRPAHPVRGRRPASAPWRAVDGAGERLLVRARPSRALLRRPAGCDEAARGARAISKRSEPIADQEIAEDKESRAAIGFNQIETRSGRASALCPDRKSTRLNSSH